MTRRRPAERGHRPAAGVRFAAGWCRVCGAAFVLDRQLQPWARARTCSEECRARLGNRGRTAFTCGHCVMVQGYHDTRVAHVEAAGGWRNEHAAEGAVLFGEWLRRYEWGPGEDAAA